MTHTSIAVSLQTCFSNFQLDQKSMGGGPPCFLHQFIYVRQVGILCGLSLKEVALQRFKMYVN